MALTVHTEWNMPLEGADLDAEKHEAFANFAMSLVQEEAPDLYYFLDATDAHVLVGVGVFSFTMPFQPGELFDVEEVAQKINFLPWAEPNEAMH